MSAQRRDYNRPPPGGCSIPVIILSTILIVIWLLFVQAKLPV